MIGTLFFIYGLLLGSFYNVVIYRLPLELPIHKGRSYCPTCHTKLRSVDLVPVLSFAYLGGKCRYCKTKISFRYPIIELTTGILFVLAYQNFGLGYEGLLYISFWSMLLIVAMIDFDHMVIMDSIILFFTVVHLLLLYTIGFSWQSAFLGAAVGAGLYGLIYIVSKWVYKKEAFGTGDVVLMGAIGVVFGPQKALVTGMMAFYVALFGILVIKLLKKDVNRETEIPFGPYVCIAAFVMSLYGNQIMGYLLGILGL